MRVALFHHPDRPSVEKLADRFEVAAKERNVAITDEPDAGTDVIVAIGGDGTVLEAVRHALAHDVPVLGINGGNVGYLAAVDAAQIEDALDLIASGKWEESSRMTIEVTCEGSTIVGLNDVVIEKAVSQHAVSIALAVGDRHFTTYRADGIVVATPTGSTAYAFSAGGPMIDPELEAIVVTPVAAHNLFAPTVLFSPTSTLTFVSQHARRVRINVDGREAATVAGGVEITVRKSSQPARFVVPWDRPFDQVVREKFGLGGD